MTKTDIHFQLTKNKCGRYIGNNRDFSVMKECLHVVHIFLENAEFAEL